MHTNQACCAGWYAKYGTFASDGAEVFAPDGECIATVHDEDHASLIAAAPGMLAALRELLPIVESLDISAEPGDEPIPCIAAARAIINKAEGR